MEPRAVPSNRKCARGCSLFQRAHSARLIPAERNVLQTLRTATSARALRQARRRSALLRRGCRLLALRRRTRLGGRRRRHELGNDLTCLGGFGLLELLDLILIEEAVLVEVGLEELLDRVGRELGP